MALVLYESDSAIIFHIRDRFPRSQLLSCAFLFNVLLKERRGKKVTTLYIDLTFWEAWATSHVE